VAPHATLQPTPQPTPHSTPHPTKPRKNGDLARPNASEKPIALG